MPKKPMQNKPKPAQPKSKQGEVRTGEKKIPATQQLFAASAKEDCVAICIHRQQPTVRIADSDTLSALGVQPVPMENCVNDECQIPDDQKFGGEITGSSSVGWIRSEVKRRKGK